MPEGYEVEKFITDEQLSESLQLKLHRWNFAEHSDADNFSFVHDLALCVTDVFDYLTYAGSESFSGNELPPSLLPLVSRQWTHSWGKVTETVVEHDLQVKIYKREDHSEISPHIPGFADMMLSGMTFDQAVAAIASDPELQQNITPGTIVVDDAVIIRFSKEYALSWGMEFLVYKDHIGLAVFGREQETRNASQYLLTYHNKPRVLAETAAHLCVLGAKHCLRRQNYNVPDVHLSRLDKRIFNNIVE